VVQRTWQIVGQMNALGGTGFLKRTGRSKSVGTDKSKNPEDVAN
jgi:hypothetical protein